MRLILTLAALALMGLSTTALAAPPNWTGYAGLVDDDKDGYPAFVGTSTAASTGYAGAVDCDDKHKQINPDAEEIVADGIDQDCTGSDLVYPVGPPAAARYLANSGARSPLAFIAEYNRCKASANCTEDDIAGTFKASDGWQFVDVITGELPASREFSAVRIRPDGIRDVLSNTEVEYAKAHSAAAKPRSSGIGKATAVKIADERAAAAVEPLREEMLVEVDRLEDRISEVDLAAGQIFTDLAEVDTLLQGRIAASEDAIVEEARKRVSMGEWLEREVAVAKRDAKTATTTATAASSHGPLIEVGASVNVLLHRGINAVDENGTPTGDMVRGEGVGGGAFELRAGVDASGYQVAGFGQVSFGSDGQGTGSDMGLLIGADVLWDIGSVEFGPWIGYLRTEDHINLLDVSVVENGGLVGVTLQGDFLEDSALRAVPFARLGIGAGFYGNKGTTEEGTVVNSDYGHLVLFQTGIRFGAGALQR